MLSFRYFLVAFIIAIVVILPFLAFAQDAPVTAPAVVVAPAVAPVAAPAPSTGHGLFASLLAALPLLLSFGGPYLTHILQGYARKIPSSLQPIVSTAVGAIVGIIATAFTGVTVSPEVAGTLGGVAGLIGHGVMQTPPMDAPAKTVAAVVAVAPVPHPVVLVAPVPHPVVPPKV